MIAYKYRKMSFDFKKLVIHKKKQQLRINTQLLLQILKTVYYIRFLIINVAKKDSKILNGIA